MRLRKSKNDFRHILMGGVISRKPIYHLSPKLIFIISQADYHHKYSPPSEIILVR